MKNKLLLSITILFILSITTGFAQNFQPVWETPFNPMNIYVTEATLNGIGLDAGDEIGVFDLDQTDTEFCVGSVTLLNPIPEGEYVQIICSMNDGINPSIPNGFVAGNDFIFKFQVGESLIEDIDYSFPYTGYDETFNPLGTAIVGLSYTEQSSVQNLNLTEGWNSLSLNIIPNESAFSEIFGQISGELIILQNLNGVYFPSGSLNTLGQWDSQTGYLIKVNTNAAIDIAGVAIADKTINLLEGWNLLPVLSSNPVGLEDLFGINLSKIEMIKEGIGLEIYWPDKSISTLQSLQVGRSYLVKVSENFTITYK